ncbi:GTPase, G3E family [Haloechinothrix alba]|uniref:GTPase, G3E family n=1 Tax=Haloechinothrix alba TaxID=664784 RepID=A0A238X7Q0_9PSEU|nr:GTP-binding protein [Haloechinothrix alba]SNR54648.1 GTPase, G3E family [Haloechinothrix alba]
MPEQPRTPVVLITGISPAASVDLGAELRTVPGTVVIHHDLRSITEGVVRRRVQCGARDELTALELAHGCVSCTMREDLLPLLCTLAGDPGVARIVVRLDEAMEPEPVCYAIANVLVNGRAAGDLVEVEGVLATVDLASWFDDVTGEDLLCDRGMQASPEDERTVAQLAATQVEFADVLVCAGQAPDTWTAARTDAVLDRLAPGVPRLPLGEVRGTSAVSTVPGDARRGRLTDMHGPVLRGQPPLEVDSGVATVLFTDPRPFHPERLHEAIDVLLDGVVRTTGRAWVASRPDAALWMESAGGGMGVGHAGGWIAGEDGPDWDDVSDERRAMAWLRWHPRFGDRAQELVITTHRTPPDEITSALTRALLTDEEIAAGPAVWATYPDPFGDWHEDPCEEVEVPDGHSEAGTARNQEETGPNQ